uniref:Uncharacterized protein n=1 Tax=Kalanchoe fedtschenkoi TaxID=63787 RepID=A0A7N0VE55_KALFE
METLGSCNGEAVSNSRLVFFFPSLLRLNLYILCHKNMMGLLCPKQVPLHFCRNSAAKSSGLWCILVGMTMHSNKSKS